jgi:hypothetical protein
MKKFACLAVVCALTGPWTQAQPAATNESGVQLTIELRDGSHVVGKSVEGALSFHSATLGDAKLPWSGIRSIEYAGTNTTMARLTAAAGDTFAVTLAGDALRVETGFGQNEFPVKLIRSVKVSPAGAAAVGAGEARLTIELRDGSRVVGKGLDDSLSFHSPAMGDLKLAWPGIRSIDYTGTNTGMAQLTATNGDVYEVQFEGPAVRVETSFGKTELPVNLIRSIKTSATGNVTQGLVGWWKLDDGSGTVAKDSSGNAYDGKLINGPVWTKVPGRDEVCLQFNGADGLGYSGAMLPSGGDGGWASSLRPSQGQYVSLGNILQGSYSQLSIACWIKHPSSGWENVVERGNWDTPDGIGLMMDYQGQTVRFGFYKAPNTVGSKATVQDDQWHHVVGTLSKTKSDGGLIYSIYVDGKLDNTATGPTITELAATSQPWAIGARYDGTYGYRGLIEDVRIYDRALSPAEVQAIYEERNHGEPLPPSPAGSRGINSSD